MLSTLLTTIALLLGVCGSIYFLYTTFAKVKLTDHGIDVKAFPYSFELPSSSIGKSISIIEKDKADVRLPRLRINGISLFGLNVGWFLDKTNTRVFMLTKRGEPWIYVPSSSGVSLIISSPDAQSRVREIGACRGDLVSQ